ncbi:hypothetical protein C500_14640 [Natrialba magadii ATCC 43099]|uniref:Uncharacterized protein n=1 Tax=Natrialba magadii (strain ATCC 43099 / DSM 3394 / CCM 3739 / CIP 104546 / IAM 13178 / JCM 8861 / NBRC 102185 / NCIMB 2190 / MS3) TaxID=547559 RepID=L9UQE2_NATMM|nr:hypothetical protein C500_14640 [Natrialba magadii ATCC 43099]
MSGSDTVLEMSPEVRSTRMHLPPDVLFGYLIVIGRSTSTVQVVHSLPPRSCVSRSLFRILGISITEVVPKRRSAFDRDTEQ